MTAVASPPTFPQISRSAWGSIDGNNSMNPDEGRGMFMPRKTLSRNNSSSSLSSNSSAASGSTILSNGSSSTPVSSTSDLSQWSAAASRKRPQPKSQPWPPGKGEVQPDFSRLPAGRPNGMVIPHGSLQAGPNQVQISPQAMMAHRGGAEQLPPGQPVLYLLSLNGTFERKTIAVPFSPETLRIGRQTNQKTIPTATNGFFDSKVLSRQHAEVYSERNGKIYIRDVKSSNGTFVNGTRLSQENRESEPHELQTGDHLELGIDIVSEDQKTVVHHKVAAKVEHAGFMSSSNNVLDMNFGDLDPANSTMMMPSGPMQVRGRVGSNASMVSSGRMMPGAGPLSAPPNAMGQQRPFLLSPVGTDQILKRLANEMRGARLQAQDLSRTSQFVNTLLTKNDVKDLEKPEVSDPTRAQPMVNGNKMPFRADPKTRFSEPPAPPPQQPLPEKPDVPSLKRPMPDRPKSGPPNTSPVRPDNMSQIVQLTEALNNAKRDIDSQTARMRELEDMLRHEREARAEAEDLARRLEESAQSAYFNGSINSEPADITLALAEDKESQAASDPEQESNVKETPVNTDVAEESAKLLQSRIDTMESQVKDVKDQMEEWKRRCEVAESERDEDRKTLAEMVIQLRAEEAKRIAAQRERRSRSRQRRQNVKDGDVTEQSTTAAGSAQEQPNVPQSDGTSSSTELGDDPTLSRANTITPMNSFKAPVTRDGHVQAGLPYISALGVVMIGMGLMAYINGWQERPSRIDG